MYILLIHKRVVEVHMMTISYPEGTTVSGEIIKLDDFVVITRTYSNGVKIMLRESENGVSINITGLEEE